MLRNSQKFTEMQRNVEKCREIQISLNPMHLDNMAHVGSYRNLKNLVEF